MAPWDRVANVWKNVQEVDLRPIRAAAEQVTTIALVQVAGAEASALAAALNQDPQREGQSGYAPILTLNLEQASQADHADLIVLVVPPGVADHSPAQAQVQTWQAAGKNILVLITQDDSQTQAATPWVDWRPARVVHSPLNDPRALQENLAPVVADMLPDRLLSLGRHFPLLREPLAHRLINEVCFSNAVYAFSTGLAEVVPVLDVPLNIADIIVLTKAQALLVYRLGLLLGLPTDWRYYLAEFSSVIGGGFLWRQAARSLVGLIPVVGIVPKVAVAYAGTFVVGQAVLRWHQTGRHISRKEISGLYRQALIQGKTVAGNLLSKAPRPRLRRRRRKTKSLPAPQVTCADCQTPNDPDARFCKHCGQALAQGEGSEQT